MKSYRRILCLVFSLALLSGAVAAHAQEKESLASIITNADVGAIPGHRTSIIYIQCHGLGYGDLSCYGQTNYQTPNLDRLAAGGIRFTGFSPASTNFNAALASLIYGKNSAPTGPTPVGNLLSTAGYHTGLIGEWTLDDHPWMDGFDEFGGFLKPDEGRNYFAESFWRFDPPNTYDLTTHTWVELKPGMAHNSGPEMLYYNTGGKHEQYLPEVFFNMTCNFLKNHEPDQFNKFKPFFLVVNLPQPRSASPAADQFPVPSDAPFSDEKWPQAAKDRASLITRLDGGIGRIMTELAYLHLTNNVAIFFSSSEAPEKFKNPKLDFMAPNGTAVAGENGASAPLPMIVWCPPEIPGGQVSNFKWTSADFFPTALQIASVKPPKDLGGISILPVLQGKKGPDVDLPAPRTRPPVGPGGKPF
jgi:arylsulfatase A-like enzyme